MRISRLFTYISVFFISFSVSSATECPNLSDIDFGPCFMIIGWGWNGDDCVQLGGCGSTDYEGNDYSDFLFWSYESCMETCPCVEGYVDCFVDPCEVTDCPAYPNAVCEADYCGGCNANFYENGDLVNNECEDIQECSEEFEGSGDITFDMQTNVLDIVIAVNIALSGVSPSEEELCVLDLNEDEVINVLDIILIIDIILNPVDTSYTINSGTSFGECWGYCLSELDLQGTNANFTIYGWWEDDPDFPTLSIDSSISIDEWNEILDVFDFDEYMQLDEMYGCPDCADGGSEWIEITHDGITKRVTFEANDSIPGHDELVIQLRELRAYYFIILDPWGE
ncbi:MAG: hypothetical protein H8E72_06430 [Candidatus Marinimicrobia bacterium]|nr:hypothetical protein [Candidatus Neomarinimicrobiota bacterium]